MREVTIPVIVPENRVAEFYERHGQWLASLEGGESTGQIDTMPPTRRSRRTKLAWTRDDADIAEYVWNQSPEDSQHLIDAVMESGEATADDLLRRFNLPGLPQLGARLARPGRLAAEQGRKRPVRRRHTADRGIIYFMEPHVRDLFRRAKDAG